MEHGFTWFGIIPGLSHIPHYIAGSILVFVIVAILSVFVKLSIKKRKDLLVPDRHFTILHLFDWATEKLFSLAETIMGHETKKFFPLMGALFIYIFISNLFGLIPGLLPPTDNLNTNFACALTVFIYYNYQGFKTHGFRYIKHFLGPIWWLSPMILVIELVSHLVRPASLSIRLFGNISGDHMVLGIFSHLVPLGVPVIFLFLGLFVSFIQAFVFTLLSMVYVSLATAHEGH